MVSVYIDTSGSMTEMGKDSALLYLAKSIEDYCYFKGIDTAFFTIDGNVVNDLKHIKYSNDIKPNTINIQSNNILLSDGLFHSEENNIFDIAISIGIDSDTTNLKKISSKVFSSDEILSGLEYLLYRNNLLNSNTAIEDDEDEW